MYGDLTGTRDLPEGTMTLEKLKGPIEEGGLGPEGLAFLKANDPKAYYSFIQPQTIGGLEELSQMSLQGLTNSPEDRQLAARIVEAREAVSRQKDAQDRRDGGGGAGIMGAVPTPFTDVNNNGILDSLEVAQATTTPAATTTVPAAIATAPTPFDYSRWPSYGPAGGPVPNYVNQGLGQGSQFDYWNQIANAFPGMRNYG